MRTFFTENIKASDGEDADAMGAIAGCAGAEPEYEPSSQDDGFVLKLLPGGSGVCGARRRGGCDYHGTACSVSSVGSSALAAVLQWLDDECDWVALEA